MSDSFVYCWSNLSNGKVYVGYHKGDINDGYICSSKSKTFWEDFYNNDMIWYRQIITKSSIENCIKLETKILKALKNNNGRMYNKNINGVIIWDDELKLKASLAHMGKKQSEQHLKNRCEALIGRVGGFLGRKHSIDTILKMKNVKREKIKCKYCYKEIPVHLINRWHNENCKEKH